MDIVRQHYSTLKESQLFADIPASTLAQVLAKARLRNFASREVIFLEGDLEKAVLLLLTGRVKITQNSPDGEEVILRLDLPGDLIGEPTFNPESTHTSSAQAAHQDCSALAWDIPIFEEACQRFPILQRNRQRILERRIRELEQRFCEISTAKVSRRVAQTLLRLWNQIGHKADGPVQIDIQQEEVAQMSATTGSTVNRLLSDWEKQGLVCRRRSAILIRSYEGMLELCNGARVP